MAVKIIKIKPRQAGIPAAETAKVRAHVDLESFMWEDNSTLNKGTTTRQNMFDWIVNKKGIAYVEDRGNKIPVYGAVTPDGKKYIRTVRDNAWTDELLNLDGF